jgi:hypothetical protein
MIPQDSQTYESYVPVYDVVPAQWEQARPIIVEQLKRLANAVNLREIGWFLDEELLSGKAFIPGVNNTSAGQTGQNFRSVFRKVIDFGALPDNTSKSVPHGIVVDANFSLTDFFGVSVDPLVPQGLPIPYVSVAGLIVQLDINSTNIIITTNSAFSRFTRTYITVEYIQEL